MITSKMMKSAFALMLVVCFGSICGISSNNNIGRMSMNTPKNIRPMEHELTITQKGNNVVAMVALPGFEKKNITVRVRNGALWIVAKRTEKNEIKEKNYYKKDASENDFEEMEDLPCKVNASAMDVNFEDGVLTVTIPKA